MEAPANGIESIIQRVEAYGRTMYDLAKYKLLESTIEILTSILSRLGIILVFSFFLLILNIGIALFLGDLLGKLYYGFFIIAAFYLLAGIVLHFFIHRWIRKPVSDIILRQVRK